MTGSDFDWINQDLAAAHKASGMPRYSIYLALQGGGFVRRWTDDRSEALAYHADAVADPKMGSVITFDHLDVDNLAVDFAPHRKSAAELKAECDEALDRMWDRWLADEIASGGGGC